MSPRPFAWLYATGMDTLSEIRAFLHLPPSKLSRRRPCPLRPPRVPDCSAKKSPLLV